MKYYNAYDDRYKKAHEEDIIWFTEKPTPEVLGWVNMNQIPEGSEILEVGCGEGRDLLNLSLKGYKMTGIDTSKHAIRKVNELADNKGLCVSTMIADAVDFKNFDKKYKWIYSVATLHMLVEDDDRKKFLSTLSRLLADGGKLLLVNKGDGASEFQTDIEKAFDLTSRTHMDSKKEIQVTTTSYRCMNWKNHIRELEEAGFIVDKSKITQNYQYDQCMTVYLANK